MLAPWVICLTLLMQLPSLARSLAIASAGSSNDARMAMMAMTTKSSIKVNAPAGAVGRVSIF